MRKRSVFVSSRTEQWIHEIVQITFCTILKAKFLTKETYHNCAASKENPEKFACLSLLQKQDVRRYLKVAKIAIEKEIFSQNKSRQQNAV